MNFCEQVFIYQPAVWYMLALEKWCKGSKFVRQKDETSGRFSPVLLFSIQMLRVPFNSLRLLVGCQEGHLACEKPVWLIPRVLFQNKWRKKMGNWLTHLHVENNHWNRVGGAPVHQMCLTTVQPLTYYSLLQWSSWLHDHCGWYSSHSESDVRSMHLLAVSISAVILCPVFG